MGRFFRLVGLLGCLLVFSQAAVADSLDGLWSLTDKPVYMSIQSPLGLIAYSQKDPDAVGKTLLRNLVADDRANTWQGEIYVQQLNSYKDAQITLMSTDSMKVKVKVGFISKTVYWERSAQLPESSSPAS
jgi:uncharacterized protein (DUF2147 family)